jgi:tetratricopeptide (TPR) repeat protein
MQHPGLAASPAPAEVPIGSVFLSVASLIALLIVCPLALADEPTDEHKREKDAAYAAFELGRYDEAIGHFEKAYRLKRDPRLLYNLGLAYYRRHELSSSAADLRQAQNLFRRFLQLVPEPDARAPDRQKVLDARRWARRYLKKIELLSPQTQPTSSPTSMAASLPVIPRRDPPKTEPPRAPHETPQKRDRRYAHWVLYALAGSTGAAAAVTGGLALHADHSSDDLASAGDRRANDEAERARGFGVATDVLIGTAVVSAAAAVVLHLWYARR